VKTGFAAVCALAAIAAGCTAVGSAGPSLHACRGVQPRPVEHVIWIWMENKPYDAAVGNNDAPFINKLAHDCGVARRYSGITNPSLPNYIAATSGTLPRTKEKLAAIIGDQPPTALGAVRLVAESIYTQLSVKGLSWRNYEEAMPRACMLTNNGRYAARHNPAVYYGRISLAECTRSDVPLGRFSDDIENDRLPAFAFVTPDLCNDGHGAFLRCGRHIENSDRWLARWIPVIVKGDAYKGGHTVVFITWDEGKVGKTRRLLEFVRPSERGRLCAAGSLERRCHVAMLVVSPSTRPCTTSDVPFNHYSLLRTTEELLGLRLLAHAGDRTTRSMSGAFDLTPGLSRGTETTCG
jgi:phosphatidylinositol-3-phosphatase